MRLKGKRILITGAGRGIGRAVACQAAREGAWVALNSRTESELDVLAATLRDEGGECLVTPGDIGCEETVRRIFCDLRRTWGGLDGLVNGAAIFKRGLIRDMVLSDFQEVMRVNLIGPLLCAREAFGCMLPGGTVVNISSLSGVAGVQKFEGFTAYGLSKFGLVGLTEMMALEGKILGIRSNCISPGAVDTGMLAEAAPGLVPFLEPTDVADVVCFLLSAESCALNGANLILDGNSRTGGAGKP
ncbi:MAG: SDR family oxidoreductase [Candidatus Firestonebacteria bacterium]|nr:SDR family oxidoreductase [Candidatus Firestonebacteria bacterium]